MDRIHFSDQKDLRMLFNDVKQTSKLSWNKIAKNVGTTRSMLNNYRSGKILLSIERFNLLQALLDAQNKEHYSNLALKKEGNWGQIKGGKAAYKINKKYFDFGREKAKQVNGVKYEFDINMLISEELSEFIGAIIGDGFTNKYGHSYETQITGDRVLDKEYYHSVLGPICKKLFKISPKIVERPGRINLTIYSKRLYELLVHRFGIPPGIKCYTVMVPREILIGDKKMLRATLRGMFNTDGGVGFDKRKIYKKPYIRVNYTSASRALIDQLGKILHEFEIPYSVHTNRKSQIIQINGEKNVRMFLNKIGFSNKRHLKKIGYLIRNQ